MRKNKILYKNEGVIKSNFPFILFMMLLIETYLRLSARIDAVAIIRPTLTLTLLVTLALFANKHAFKGIRKDPIVKAMNVFILYLVISLPIVEFPGSVLNGNLSNFVRVVVFFYFTAMLVDTPKRLVVFLFIFVGLQVFRGIEPLFLHLTEGYWGDITYSGGGEFANRLAGAPADVVNPNGLGFVIVTAIPYLHYLMLPKGKFVQLLYFVILSLLLFALLLTMSRGGMIALAVVGWIMLRKSNYKFLLILIVMVFLMVGWSQIDGFQKDRYLSIVGLAKSSQNVNTSEGRINGMLGEFTIGLSRPIVGHGIGTTKEAKYNLKGSSQASHNMYGELIIEAGLFGLFFFLKYVFSIKNTIVRLKEKILTYNLIVYANLQKALMAVLIMFSVYSLNYFGVSQYYWYLFGGLVVAVNRIAEQVMAKSEIDEK